jgi:hypothetical protein
MLAPVKYCKFCYLETADDEYSIPPGLVIALSMASIIAVLILFYFR